MFILSDEETNALLTGRNEKFQVEREEYETWFRNELSERTEGLEEEWLSGAITQQKRKEFLDEISEIGDFIIYEATLEAAKNQGVLTTEEALDVDSVLAESGDNPFSQLKDSVARELDHANERHQQFLVVLGQELVRKNMGDWSAGKPYNFEGAKGLAKIRVFENDYGARIEELQAKNIITAETAGNLKTVWNRAQYSSFDPLKSAHASLDGLSAFEAAYLGSLIKEFQGSEQRLSWDAANAVTVAHQVNLVPESEAEELFEKRLDQLQEANYISEATKKELMEVWQKSDDPQVKARNVTVAVAGLAPAVAKYLSSVSDQGAGLGEVKSWAEVSPLGVNRTEIRSATGRVADPIIVHESSHRLSM